MSDSKKSFQIDIDVLKGHKRISRNWPVNRRKWSPGRALICYELITSDRTHGEVSVSGLVLSNLMRSHHIQYATVFLM